MSKGTAIAIAIVACFVLSIPLAFLAVSTLSQKIVEKDRISEDTSLIEREKSRHRDRWGTDKPTEAKELSESGNKFKQGNQSAPINETGQSLDATLSTGRKVVGEYVVEGPANSKVMEVDFTPEVRGSEVITLEAKIK